MTDIAFNRITPDESRVYFDGDLVGEVHLQDNILKSGSHYYVCWLDEDHRGPVRIHDRSSIREVVTRRGRCIDRRRRAGQNRRRGPRRWREIRLDVMSHFPTRAHCANPAFGRVLHSADAPFRPVLEMIRRSRA